MAGMALLLVVLGGCQEGERSAGRVVIAAGGGRGAYLPYGEALARAASAAGLDARVVSASSAADGLTQVGRGEADVTFAPADLAALAVAGAEPFGRRVDAKALARLYDDYTHLVVAADTTGGRRSPPARCRCIRGRRATTGSPRSPVEAPARTPRARVSATRAPSRAVTRRRPRSIRTPRAVTTGRARRMTASIRAISSAIPNGLTR